MKNHSRRAALILLAVVTPLALILSGCKVGPNFKPPQAKVPPGWTGITKTPSAQPSAITAQPPDLTEWWRKFNDPKLVALVDEALKQNLDLQLAEARLRQARASRGVVAGGLWPAINSTADYRRQRLSTGRTGPAVGPQDLFLAGLDAVWEMDIFGGIRRNVESAGANILAARESIHDVQVTLAAEVALNYLQLRGFQQQIAIAQNNLKAQQHTADITRQRFNAGFVSGLDVANADAQVASTESTIPVLETAARQSIYALSVLLARLPADLVAELSTTEPLPTTPPEVPVGLPSELLRRRPDIRQAEAQLHAATAQIGVAVADLFPKFSLTGSITYQANLVQNWFTDPSRSWAFGPSVSWPVFQGGSIRSNIKVQEALRDQSYITYQKTVLGALQEVENALIAFNKEWEHRKALNDAVVANRKAVDLSTQLYTQGATDFLNVLSAQRSLFASEDALVQSNRNVATDLVAIYKALGGGWQDVPPQLQANAAAPAGNQPTAPGNK